MQDARREGASEEELETLRAWLVVARPSCEVWPENVEALAAFLVASTQWRVVSLNTMTRARMLYLGLDYAGARAGIEAAGITITPSLWADLYVMEVAARAALNEER